MAFVTLHKLCSYLLAFTGFLSILLPNELHPMMWLVVLGGIGFSWRFEPPRTLSKSYRLFWTQVTVFLVIGLIFVGVSGIFANPILIACYVLVVLQINKLFNRNSHRDYLQIYVLSFLMLTIGTILNTDIGYAFTFLLYVIFITWTLTLFHLRREIEGTFLMRHTEDLNEAEKVDVSQILQSRRLIRGSFLGATSVIALVVFVLSSLIFFLFPRIGFGLFFQRKRTGPKVSGFSNRVELGSFGRIRTSRAVVMRVELPNQKKSQPRLPYYWRGLSYDRYDGKFWKRSKRYNKLALFNPPDSHKIYKFTDAMKKRMIKQVVYQEPLDVPVLFGIDRPFMIQIPTNIPTRVRHMVPRVKRDLYSDGLSYSNILAQGSSIRYTVYSLPTDVRPPGFRRAKFQKKIVKLYLQLPKNLDPKVRTMALRVTRGLVFPGDKARAIQRFLQNNYKYSLVRKAPVGSPLSDFLFRQKRGHCEYFSSAMAILLRSIGVPTRQVTGFYTAEWNAYGKYYAVRQSDAHAWVEVYEKRYGWKRYDPSPTAPSVKPNRLFKVFEEYFDSLRLAWYKWVVEYDLENQIAALKSLRERFSNASQKFNGFSFKAWLKRIWYNPTLRFLSLGSMLLLFGLLVSWFVRRRRRYPRSPKAVYSMATKLYLKSLRLLKNRGFERMPAETPHEFAARMGEELPKVSKPLRSLTEHYLVLRYNPANENSNHHLDLLHKALQDITTQVKEK